MSDDGRETFGEAVDRMSTEARKRMFETTRREGETFAEWLASLHRPAKREKQGRLFDG